MEYRKGARQPHRFDPARADVLDDEAREEWLPSRDVFASLDAPEHGRVLDFGAGTGYLTFRLAADRRDLHIFAYDEQEPMLARLRERKRKERAQNVTVIDESAFAGIANVDVIMAVNVLHELTDRALESLVSALDERGAVTFVDWNAAIERPVGPPKAHAYTIDEAKRRLADAGFVVHREELLRYHYVLRAGLYR